MTVNPSQVSPAPTSIFDVRSCTMQHMITEPCNSSVNLPIKIKLYANPRMNSIYFKMKFEHNQTCPSKLAHTTFPSDNVIEIGSVSFFLFCRRHQFLVICLDALVPRMQIVPLDNNFILDECSVGLFNLLMKLRISRYYSPESPGIVKPS